MKKLFFYSILLSMAFAFQSHAQDETITLFPGGAPGEKIQLTEKSEVSGSTGGEPVLSITDVSSPTISVYFAPEELSSGTAMVVCPGGAYNFLSYNMEGTEVCEWLNSLGITAVLLKYRVPRREGQPKHLAPLQDVQRALSCVRFHAEEWGLQPDKIGVMGFSAGGHLSCMASTAFAERAYDPIDEWDKKSCRPDFCLLVYPAYIDGEGFRLAEEVKISENVPPTMMIQTEDDVDYVNSSIFYFFALKEAKIPAWLHIYSSGGHGYGLRDTGHAVNEWHKRAEDWFLELGLIDSNRPDID